jgi:hypothetical protein
MKKIFSLVISLIVLIIEGHKQHINTPIVIFKNKDNTKINKYYNDKQEINGNILKIKGENQNFIQWFIINFNPLIFFVMENSTLQDISKGVILYKLLNSFILPNEKITKSSFVHNILFQDIDIFNIKNTFDKYYEKIIEEQKTCTFFDSSDNIRINKTDETDETSILQMFSKLKLARFKPVKYGECIDNIQLYWEPYCLHSVYLDLYETEFIQNMKTEPIYENIIENIDNNTFKYIDPSNKEYCMRNLKGDGYYITI